MSMIIWLCVFSIGSYAILFSGIYNLIAGGDKMSWLLLLIGGAFSAAITFLDVAVIRNWKKNKQLESKKQITATITGFETDESVTFNGTAAVRIKCEHKDKDGVTQYISDNVFIVPDKALIGTPICVYYDDSDPGDYHVDTSRFAGESLIPFSTPILVGGLFSLIGSLFFFIGIFGGFTGGIFAGIGGFFLLLGGGILLYFIRQERREKAQRFMSVAEEIAVVTRLKYRKGHFFNGVDPCSVVCTYQSNGKTKTVVSEDFYHPDPEQLIGKELKLIRSRINPRVVEPDLSSIIHPGQMRASEDGPFLTGWIINTFAVMGTAVFLSGLIVEIILSQLSSELLLPNIFHVITTSFLCFFGLVFGSIGYIPIIFNSIKRKKQRKLRSTGKRIQAVVFDVTVNKKVSTNSINPSVLTCKSTDPEANDRIFKCGSIYRSFDRIQLVGKPVTVFVSASDPNQYLVDVVGLLSQYENIIRRES